MKKGDVVWCWNYSEDNPWLRIYVGKEDKGHRVTGDKKTFYTAPVSHCELYESFVPPLPAEFQPGELVKVSDEEGGWFVFDFIGFNRKGIAVVEDDEGTIWKYKHIKTLRDKLTVKPMAKCFKLLIKNGWIMDQLGVWRSPDGSEPLVCPSMLLNHCDLSIYPDFLLEEVAI